MNEVLIYIWEDLFLYCYEFELEDFIDIYGNYDKMQTHSEFYERDDIEDFVS